MGGLSPIIKVPYNLITDNRISTFPSGKSTIPNTTNNVYFGGIL